MTASTELLTTGESAQLAAAEAVIAAGIKTFVEVGEALAGIRDQRLYRAAFPTFEDYCRQRWNFGRNYANKVIAAAEMTKALGTAVPTPVAERVVRALAPLKAAPETMKAAYAEAVTEAGGAVPTADAVKAIVDRWMALPAPEPQPSSRQSTGRNSVRTLRRRPLPKQLVAAVYELRKAAERLERLVADDRFPQHRDEFISRCAVDLGHIETVLLSISEVAT